MWSQRRVRPQQKSVRPRLEKLESRIAPAVFNVSGTGGIGALREAIQQADTNKDASNTIYIASSTYMLSDSLGEILIQDQPATARTLTLAGQGETIPFSSAADRAVSSRSTATAS